MATHAAAAARRVCPRRRRRGTERRRGRTPRESSPERPCLCARMQQERRMSSLWRGQQAKHAARQELPLMVKAMRSPPFCALRICPGSERVGLQPPDQPTGKSNLDASLQGRVGRREGASHERHRCNHIQAADRNETRTNRAGETVAFTSAGSSWWPLEAADTDAALHAINGSARRAGQLRAHHARRRAAPALETANRAT